MWSAAFLKSTGLAWDRFLDRRGFLVKVEFNSQGGLQFDILGQHKCKDVLGNCSAAHVEGWLLDQMQSASMRYRPFSLTRRISSADCALVDDMEAGALGERRKEGRPMRRLRWLA